MTHLQTKVEKIGRGLLDPENTGKRPEVRPEYPATRAQIIEACIDLEDCEDGERAWLLGALPDAVFESAEEVLTALLA